MVITCQNASFGYEGNAVVHGLNFTVESGDYLWIVGENGSGKTTLIKGILKLLNPLEGNIVFCGELARGKIGYLSQQSAPKKDFPAGVREIVLSGNLNAMGFRPFYRAKEKKAAEAVMERLGIQNLAKDCYRELSGGQQRRVLLARALVSAQVELRDGSTPGRAISGGADNAGNKENFRRENSRRLLVLDEPAASLDPLVTAEVYDLLKGLNRQTGITVIMVSHDIRAAAQYANRILHLENGMGFFSETGDYLQSDRGKKYFGPGKEQNNDQHTA